MSQVTTPPVHKAKPARDYTPVVLTVAALALVGLAWRRSRLELALAGLLGGGRTLLNAAPLLVLALLVAFLIFGPMRTLEPHPRLIGRLNAERRVVAGAKRQKEGAA